MSLAPRRDDHRRHRAVAPGSSPGRCVRATRTSRSSILRPAPPTWADTTVVQRKRPDVRQLLARRRNATERAGVSLWLGFMQSPEPSPTRRSCGRRDRGRTAHNGPVRARTSPAQPAELGCPAGAVDAGLREGEALGRQRKLTVMLERRSLSDAWRRSAPTALPDGGGQALPPSSSPRLRCTCRGCHRELAPASPRAASRCPSRSRRPVVGGGDSTSPGVTGPGPDATPVLRVRGGAGATWPGRTQMSASFVVARDR